MPFQSYAQNAEDVILWRVFKDQAHGFYIDVGASLPNDSVTRAFYERGWRGINIEPLPHLMEAVRQHRPEDVNLELAVSNSVGSARLYTTVDPAFGGYSTLEPQQSSRLNDQGYATRSLDVPMTTLAEICAAHVRGPIDFLKIDVEGHEKAVIEGADWSRWRPRVLVVEATEPNSPRPSHQAWEPLLLTAGYLFALFDGLNRFYVREEDRELLPVLSVPANVFDDFIPAHRHHYIKWLEDTVALRSEELHLARHEVQRLQHEYQAYQQHAQRQIAGLSERLESYEEQLKLYMGPAGVMWWLRHRVKSLLGMTRQRQAA